MFFLGMYRLQSWRKVESAYPKSMLPIAVLVSWNVVILADVLSKKEKLSQVLVDIRHKKLWVDVSSTSWCCSSFLKDGFVTQEYAKWR